MTDLNIIEKIGFEDGSFLTVDQLPAPMKTDVERYNKWTAELAGIIEDLTALQDKQSLIVYARAGAYASINQAAVQLQTQLQEQKDEASTPTDSDSTVPVAAEDSQ